MMNIIPDAILPFVKELLEYLKEFKACLLYTSDAADE